MLLKCARLRLCLPRAHWLGYFLHLCTFVSARALPKLLTTYSLHSGCSVTHFLLAVNPLAKSKSSLLWLLDLKYLVLIC